MEAEPVHVKEMVPGESSYVGYCDACQMGAGRVWFSRMKHLDHTVWLAEWPDNIKAALITRENPNIGEQP